MENSGEKIVGRIFVIGCPRFFSEKGIRPGFDQAAFDALRNQYASQARMGFVQDILERHTRAAFFFECEGGRETGNAAADDGDTFRHSAIGARTQM